MARQLGGIIDGDGHIHERDDDIRPYLEGKYHHQNLMNYAFFPSIDRWRRRGAGGGEPSSPEMWLRFLDGAEIDGTPGPICWI